MWHSDSTRAKLLQRCGASLKTRNDSAPNATIAAYLTTITIVALAGLGIMFAGSLVLRNEAHFGGEISYHEPQRR